MDEILSHSMDFGCPFMQSLPARGAWIEIFLSHNSRSNFRSLPARGAWIEIDNLQLYLHGFASLPARGAWIEITPDFWRWKTPKSLPARGAWIEIIYVPNGVWYTKSRSPQGERGLKSMPNALGLLVSRSLPARGAWIEIEL